MALTDTQGRLSTWHSYHGAEVKRGSRLKVSFVSDNKLKLYVMTPHSDA